MLTNFDNLIKKYMAFKFKTTTQTPGKSNAKETQEKVLFFLFYFIKVANILCTMDQISYVLRSHKLLKEKKWQKDRNIGLWYVCNRKCFFILLSVDRGS